MAFLTDLLSSSSPGALAFLSGPWEWIIILAVVLLLFGGRIPKMARSLGQGIVEFRKGLKGEGEEPKELSGEQKQSLPGDSTAGSGSSSENVQAGSTQERHTG